jgi:DNA-binding transcriptional ArsR family regulator
MNTEADTVFKAISDPTRRKIIDLLSRSQQSVKELTANFNMSQPAVSQHLRELRASRLVRSERVGVEQVYSLTADPLAEVFRWVSTYRMLFDPAGHAWAFAPAQGTGGRQNAKKGRDHHGD